MAKFLLHPLLGFEEEVDKFFFCMLALVLTATSTSGLAFAISARAPTATIAIVGMAGSIVLQMVRVLYLCLVFMFVRCILFTIQTLVSSYIQL